MPPDDFKKYLNKEITNAIIKKTKLFLLYIDIDNMKYFNAHNGYLAGDKLIERFAILIKPLLKHNLFFRVRGEEFAIILPAMGHQEVLHLAKKICYLSRCQLAGEQPLHCGDKHCMGVAKISVSIGMESLKGNMDINKMRKNAEKKMYNAKRKGKDCICE